VDVDRPGPGEELNDGAVSTPRQAATVIVLRGGSQTLEVLLVQRNPAQRFMGGAWVFPGGAVDAGEGEGDGAHRAAAVRELAEEAAIKGVDPAQLVRFSEWITPPEVKIRFDTHFFLVARTGQAYLRNELDPMPLDYAVPSSERGQAPVGWKPFSLIVNRRLTVPSTKQKLPLELQDAGILRYGSWDPRDPHADSRSIWHRDGDDLVVRVPWALLGFADPSSHEVAVPKPTSNGGATLTTQTTPGITMSITAAGAAQQLTQLTWVNWTRPDYTERLKVGADRWRDATLDLAP
jgi:8-oxo-dGTP pyrophosphatase MutT (NUDIX family)